MVEKVLNKFLIGRIAPSLHPSCEPVDCTAQSVSPLMGEFYRELAERVSDKLKNIPQRPARAKILWVVDALILLSLLLYTCYVLSSVG